MKPIRLTITIELPAAGTPEREELDRTTLGELLGCGAPLRAHGTAPDDDEPADVQAGDGRGEDPDEPRDGRQLLGWIGRQPAARELKEIAARVAKEKGFGTLLVKLDGPRARQVYHEIRARPMGRPRGAAR